LLSRFSATRSSFPEQRHRAVTEVTVEHELVDVDGRGDGVDGRLHRCPQVQRRLLEAERALLDLGHRQHVLDKTEQSAAVALDPADDLTMHRGQLGVLGQERGVPDDAGDRGPQLVARRRQELLAGPVQLRQPLLEQAVRARGVVDR
jgi:hypothetical protein